MAYMACSIASYYQEEFEIKNNTDSKRLRIWISVLAPRLSNNFKYEEKTYVKNILFLETCIHYVRLQESEVHSNRYTENALEYRIILPLISQTQLSLQLII